MGGQLLLLDLIISTHAPLAGRDILTLQSDDFTKISTHAPLAGRDRNAPWPWVSPRMISTHAPLAGRDYKGGAFPQTIKDISTHAPLAGRDHFFRGPSDRDPISTHAPLAGRDQILTQFIIGHFDFNPRAPCGARQLCFGAANVRNGFQPTRPLRGATVRW